MPGFRILVVAKAPVVGEAKTRLGSSIGMRAAASVAAASLLDTIEVSVRAVGAHRCHLALAGDLSQAVDGADIKEALRGWNVHPQHGESFADRLAVAHASVGTGLPVVQIGMDTPHLHAHDLHSIAAILDDNDAVVAPAIDGGWWALGLNNPSGAAALRTVEMSTPHTGRDTIAALREYGLRVGVGHSTRDLDRYDDAVAIAAAAPRTRLARHWRSAIAGTDCAQSLQDVSTH